MDTGALHWLRPAWLWALLPLALLFLVYWFRSRKTASAWTSVVDPELQPFVFDGESSQLSLLPLILFAAWALIVLMMAGPVWQKQQMPVYQAQQSEVILFDLSASMLSDDIAPDRLSRARFKLVDLIERSQGRQSALLVFTERPYIVSPLTEDAQTLMAFVPRLHPEIMPVQGSRLDLAIESATELLQQSGVSSGHILYIGDASIVDADILAARAARDAGYRLSVLAVGTQTGTPLIDEQGRFIRDQDGRVVVPQLNMQALGELASAGDGTAVRLTTDDSDLLALDVVRDAISIQSSEDDSDKRHDYWVEYTPWLLWPLLISALMLFRKGAVA